MADQNNADVPFEEAARRVAAALREAGGDEKFVADFVGESLSCGEAFERLSKDWPWDGVPNGCEGTYGNFGPDWVIRKKDLADLLKLIPAALAAIEFVSHGHVEGSKVQSLGAAICALYRLRNKTFEPGPLQGRILVALRRAGPMTLDELTMRVNGDTGVTWGTNEVKEALAELQVARLTGGEVVPLVQCDSAKWSTQALGLWAMPVFSFFDQSELLKEATAR